jgi:protein subunit release factor B
MLNLNIKFRILYYNIHYISFYRCIRFNFCDKNKGKANISSPITIPRSDLKKRISEKGNTIKKQVTSTGPGGQHQNKTQSAVFLQDKQTNISVKVTNSRDSGVNAGIAKKRLVDKLDLHYNGSESKIAKKIEKIKKQKARNQRRSVEKYNNSSNKSDNK